MSRVDARSPSSRGLLIGLGLGLPVMAYGVRGALVDHGQTHPAELARWIIGVAVVHDGLFVPLVLGLGWLTSRLVAPQYRLPVRSALAATVVLAVFAWPFVRGYGENPTVASLLPRNYAVGLSLYVAAVWLAAVIWSLAIARRTR